VTGQCDSGNKRCERAVNHSTASKTRGTRASALVDELATACGWPNSHAQASSRRSGFPTKRMKRCAICAGHARTRCRRGRRPCAFGARQPPRRKDAGGTVTRSGASYGLEQIGELLAQLVADSPVGRLNERMIRSASRSGISTTFLIATRARSCLRSSIASCAISSSTACCRKTQIYQRKLKPLSFIQLP
jgi:hypothetical protein